MSIHVVSHRKSERDRIMSIHVVSHRKSERDRIKLTYFAFADCNTHSSLCSLGICQHPGYWVGVGWSHMAL